LSLFVRFLGPKPSTTGPIASAKARRPSAATSRSRSPVAWC